MAFYPTLQLDWAPTTKPTDASQTYTDITNTSGGAPRLLEWAWKYGRNDELGQFEAGNGYVLLDNKDRAFDPSNTAGAWYGNIKPRKAFRLRATWNAITYPVFVAYARGFPQAWPNGVTGGEVRVDLVDATAIMQSFDLVVGFTRPAELSGARITAVLDAVGIPAALRDIDAGSVEVGALDVTSPGLSALDHAREVAAASEYGQLFVAKDGKVTFHDRHRRMNAATLWTFNDNGSDLPYSVGLEANWDETYLWNYAVVSGPSTQEAAPAVAEDASSQLDYFTLTREVATQLELANDRQALADYQVQLYKQPSLRAPALLLDGAGSPAALWPTILDLEVSDRIIIKRFGSAAVPMVLTQNVEGIGHQHKAGGPWVTSVPTSPADTNVYWQVEIAGKSEVQTTTRVAA